METSIFQPLLNWIVENPNLSGFVVFCVAAIESLVVIGILVPGMAFMLGIGTLVGLDVLPLWSTLFWAVAGAIFGDGFGYWLGHHYDKQLRNLWPITRYPDLIPKGEAFFKRHGGKSVLLGRFVGPVRSVIPAIAGMMHMSPTYFYFINIVSAIAWAPVAILPGVAFGASLNMASEVALRFALLIFVVLFVVWLIAWSIKRLFAKQIALVSRRLFLIFNTLLQAKPIATMSSVIVLVVLVTGLFVAYSLMDKEAPVNYQVSKKLWWQQDWQKLPVVAGPVTVNVQLQSHLPVIEKTLLQSGWHKAEAMSFKNAVRWLTPTPGLDELPVLSHSFNTKPESLLLMKLRDSNQSALVLRIWSVQAAAETLQSNGQEVRTPVWVGALSELHVKHWLADFYTPKEDRGSVESLQWLSELLDSKVGKFKLRLESRTNSRTLVKTGEVLLIQSIEIE